MKPIENMTTTMALVTINAGLENCVATLKAFDEKQAESLNVNEQDNLNVDEVSNNLESTDEISVDEVTISGGKTAEVSAEPVEAEISEEFLLTKMGLDLLNKSVFDCSDLFAERVAKKVKRCKRAYEMSKYAQKVNNIIVDAMNIAVKIKNGKLKKSLADAQKAYDYALKQLDAYNRHFNIAMYKNLGKQSDYRGKDDKTGAWIFGKFAEFPMATFCYDRNGYYVWPIQISVVKRSLMTDVDPCSLAEYTGFNDKGGKKIYSNDILDFRGVKTLAMNIDAVTAADSKIIGNVVDNPLTFATDDAEQSYFETGIIPVGAKIENFIKEDTNMNEGIEKTIAEAEHVIQITLDDIDFASLEETKKFAEEVTAGAEVFKDDEKFYVVSPLLHSTAYKSEEVRKRLHGTLQHYTIYCVEFAYMLCFEPFKAAKFHLKITDAQRELFDLANKNNWTSATSEETDTVLNNLKRVISASDYDMQWTSATCSKAILERQMNVEEYLEMTEYVQPSKHTIDRTLKIGA